uniref:Non-specific protein-tyrosine kinase n=1 Tax=Echinostoma caproni TaxID=27848 RepID=A0A183AMM9_9TREM
LICLILVASGVCWLQRETKPEIRRVIHISHPNDDAQWPESSCPNSTQSAWTSLVSRSFAVSSGYKETLSWLTRTTADSDAEKPVLEPAVKFETVCLNGSFRTRLKTALSRRIARATNRPRMGKYVTAPDGISKEDLATSELLQSNKDSKLHHSLVSVNSRFMNFYCLEAPDPGYELPRENLRIGSFLGGGAFGMVYSGLAKDLPGQLPGSQSVAVKTLRDNFAENDVIDLLKEMDIMKQLQYNKHVIQLLAVCTQKG